MHACHRKWKLACIALENATGSSRSEKTLDSRHKVRDELSISVQDQMLLCGNCIVIPKSMGQSMVDNSYQGQQGEVKNQKLFNEKVWFPGIDELVAQTVCICIPCL